MDRRNLNKRGQIVLIALILLGSLGLIGVSVATQMVLEQRKAVLEEKTQAAYYAAESGIEEALKRIKEDEEVGGTLTVGGAQTQIGATEASVGNTLDVGLKINSGTPFYVNLDTFAGNSVTLCWDKANTSFVASLFYLDGADYKASYYAINTSNTQPQRINPAASIPYDTNGSGTTACGFTGYEKAITLPGGVTYDYLVVWPLYQNQIRLAFNSGATSLPEQGTVITSIGTVSELEGTVTRRLKFFQSKRDYPSSFLLTPIYVGGGIQFGEGVNW